MTTNLGVAYGPQIAAAAARHHLDARLLAAVAAQETGGPGSSSGRNIVGDGGHGRGVFQIDDRYHPFARTAAAMDPARNADYAAGLLAASLERYGGDVHAALSAYNAGSPEAAGTRTDWGDGPRLGYADSVLRHYAELGGPGTASTGPTAGPLDALLGFVALLGGSAVSGQPQLPPYRPLAQPDQNDSGDTAPAVLADGDA
ncbi:hypothetical protein WPS_19350 [Vulcanimicrobium alpinum]|uniref:Transglycosylase SLT domain-containing protein n=1 Tax=Vulcanimicrobium alpinum TaxID=3016050 RepID=A0AAN2C9T9_UNVUL|nr:transglycosylase SLT domain-containing protein [Vulcanimicrobium alpinum]BDE06659.1 hypothetical protein WPS_19350 [Vulcanimicrobium alpinum]